MTEPNDPESHLYTHICQWCGLHFLSPEPYQPFCGSDCAEFFYYWNSLGVSAHYWDI